MFRCSGHLSADLMLLFFVTILAIYINIRILFRGKRLAGVDFIIKKIMFPKVN